MRSKHPATVISGSPLSPGIFDLTLKTPIAQIALPGQFVMVYPKGADKLLPRPISICNTDIQNESIRLVYRIAGGGTSEFSSLRASDSIDVLGPIGNGFPIDEAGGRTALLMGGGIGIPPLLYLARALKDAGCASVIAALGYRDSDLFLKAAFAEYSQTLISTDDGSTGIKGTVIDAAKNAGVKPDIIYACGPMPMLKGIKSYGADLGIPTYISLEERMACGVGACLGCVCKTVHRDEHSQVNNARVCTEGPVFSAAEVDI